MTTYALVSSCIVIETLETDYDPVVVSGGREGWVEAPDEAGPGWTVTGDTFAAPSVDLSAKKAAKLADLEASCQADILGGFSSSALGSAYLYGSRATDQSNLDADLLAAATDATTTADYSCSSDNGVTWAVVTHKAAQISALAKDFRTFRIGCQAKNRTLQAQVSAATTAAAVTAIVWG